jgi:uncharacterized protein YmfQ (DUF2313 family)
VSYVQGNSSTSGSSYVNSWSVTLTNPVGVGNGVCVGFVSGVVPTLIKDDQGNIYNIELSVTDGSGTYAGCAQLIDISNGPRTITAYFPTNYPYISISADEFTNLGPLDGLIAQYVADPDSGQLVTNSFITTMVDTIWGYGTIQNNAYMLTAGAGYNIEQSSNTTNVYTESQFAVLAGSQNIVWTPSVYGSPHGIFVLGMAFQPAPMLLSPSAIGGPVQSIGGGPLDGLTHSTEDYRQAWADLLPQGTAWSRDPLSVIQTVIMGLCGILGTPDPIDPEPSPYNFDQQAATLLAIETDPRQTVIMLPDWERAFGLPDLCLAEPLTIADRQKALTARVAFTGGQSREWFLNYAASIGYEINIIEHAPYMCGISQCGSTINWNNEGAIWNRWELGAATLRFWWTIAPAQVRLTWFRCGGGGGECGVDPMLLIAQATDLECVFRRYHPAHSQINFDYGGLEPFNPYSGTGTPLEAQIEAAGGY